LRVELQRSEVAWSADYSDECKQHAEYLKRAKAKGPVAEHTQDPDQPYGSLQGRQFAARALVATGVKDPEDTVRSWLALPGYRDALLDPALESVGIFVERGTVVMDVTRGRTGPPQTVTFPGGLEPGSPMPTNPTQPVTRFVV